MRFPACELAAAPPDSPVALRSGVSGAKVLNVLAVDDDELIQCTMQALLEHLGHKVTIASSGEEAILKLEAGLKPDVIILDLNMPGLGGAGTLPRLRALNPVVPVMLATGRVDQFALNLAKANPQVTLLAKPFSLAELRERLQPIAAGKMVE
jgi:CheY-like chemotaxis protein